MRGSTIERPFPPAVRVYQLLRAGVSLQDQGYTAMPGSLGDWLIEIDAVYRVFDQEQFAKMLGAE